MRNPIYLFLPFILTVTLMGGSYAQDIDVIPSIADSVIAPIDPSIDKGVKKGLSLIYQERFKESIAVFDSMQKALPRHPAPYFYKAATLQTWMATYRFNIFLDDVNSNVEKVIELSKKALEAEPDNPWTNFYLGGAYGYRAFAKMRSYSWISAYIDGMKGLDNLKIAIDKNPHIYDVYLGLGSYHYWRTARSKFISVLAFWMSDKRDLGLEQFRFSMKHGRYSHQESAVTLLTAYFDYHKYDEALLLLNEIEADTNFSSIYVKYIHGRLMVNEKDWDATLQTFTEIYNKLKNYQYQSVGFQIECQYWSALAYHNMGRDKEARNRIAIALASSLLRDPEIEMESSFESYDEILEKIEELDDILEQTETTTDNPHPQLNTIGTL